MLHILHIVLGMVHSVDHGGVPYMVYGPNPFDMPFSQHILPMDMYGAHGYIPGFVPPVQR